VQNFPSLTNWVAFLQGAGLPGLQVNLWIAKPLKKIAGESQSYPSAGYLPKHQQIVLNN